MGRTEEKPVISSNFNEQTVIGATPPPLSVYPQYDFNRSQTIGNESVSGGKAISQPRHSPIAITLLLIVLALLVVGGGGIYFARAGLGSGGGNTITTPVIQQKQPATTAPTNVPTTVPTTVSTSSSGSGATNPYTHTGTLVLNDPLSNNTQGHVWLEGTNANGATCQFTGGVYQVTQPKSGLFHACIAQATDFSNFVLEVQMTMVSGDYAGIIFRDTSANSTYYFFDIDSTGQYYLKLYDGPSSAGRVLSQGPAPSINLGQSYLLAVVANYGNISLYIDQQQIASVTDNSYSHGQIAVFVGNVTNSAVALFRNAKVWTL